ncbi:KOW domain-containing protein [Peptoniphilus raoultii]|uniref:KOW domain-containing protein n=1 Tax=Peptoniphilus raoultii TaxID=1776387 RepID=UPI0008DADA43|nr:KOW domain-containing protein [Peptoniphilus raoultii]
MDKTISLQRGQVVKSKKGRDEGQVFVIIEIIDDNYLLLVNGKSRKLEKPKKKKVKHISIYKDIVNLDVKDINDSYIRKMLKPYS